MSVERWRMPSGRIATIDLRQSPEAVEDARQLLCDFGDSELIDEEALATDSHQGESRWRVRAVKQRAFIASGSAWAAVAPGCPAGPHPHRDCECRIFPNLTDALEFKANKESALAAGGNQREGEDQNPTKGIDL